MRIRWSPEAAADLVGIFERIRQDNPRAARNVAKVIFGRVMSLKNFPNRGRIGKELGSRELVFGPLPYIVVYRVQEDVVQISHVYHGAQNYFQG